MHTLYQRFSNVSALLSTCLLTLVGLITVSSVLFPTSAPPGTLDVTSIEVHKGRRSYGSVMRTKLDTDFAFLKLNVTADLRPLFDWNTKQLFLYIDADYVSEDGTTNTVVIWDRIVRRREDANVRTKVQSKYLLRDMAKSLKGASPANYSLKYNLMPHVGVLTYGEVARTPAAVEFPPVQKLN